MCKRSLVLDPALQRHVHRLRMDWMHHDTAHTTCHVSSNTIGHNAQERHGASPWEGSRSQLSELLAHLQLELAVPFNDRFASGVGHVVRGQVLPWNWAASLSVEYGCVLESTTRNGTCAKMVPSRTHATPVWTRNQDVHAMPMVRERDGAIAHRFTCMNGVRAIRSGKTKHEATANQIG